MTTCEKIFDVDSTQEDTYILQNLQQTRARNSQKGLGWWEAKIESRVASGSAGEP